eukprot:TRINITY_DN12902_c0_g1_i4.p2 TRINITY_DN12902_c0_g1~~TRINITY_DN12902_c0_g1_i4.p2  ORF type:complete len:118 (+),score=16.88 TRINITY_DN12902_c0_g1_i4:131-484(+)
MNFQLVNTRSTISPRRRASHRNTTICQSVAVDRRQIGNAFIGTSVLLFTGAAQARDFEAAKKAKEARRAQLKAAAEDMEKTGRSESAFEDSSYAVSEDKSPNIHSRQEEGSKTQVNA